MLCISAQQMDFLNAQAEFRFARGLAQQIVEFFPLRFTEKSTGETEEFALACVRHAKSLGLLSESALTRYANLCALIGIGFETKPFAASTGLARENGEPLDPDWLDRIVPTVHDLLLRKQTSS